MSLAKVMMDEQDSGREKDQKPRNIQNRRNRTKSEGQAKMTSQIPEESMKREEGI
jgi:hypothetical protein